MSKFDIDSYVEQLASNKNIKSFYPTVISKELGIPFPEVFSRLSELVSIGYIKLKYEIRCDFDSNCIEIVDDYSDILGSIIECDQCGEDISITLENIIPIYYINPEYRDTLKKKSQDSTHFVAIDYSQAYDKDSLTSLSEILVQEGNVSKSEVDELNKEITKTKFLNGKGVLSTVANINTAVDVATKVQIFVANNEWAKHVFKGVCAYFGVPIQ
jgi:hypothetical protein